MADFYFPNKTDDKKKSKSDINFDAAQTALKKFVDDDDLHGLIVQPAVQVETALEFGEREVNAGDFENAENILTKLIDDLQEMKRGLPQRKKPEPNTINPVIALDGLINPITNLRDQVASAAVVFAAHMKTGVVGGRKRNTRKRNTRKRKTRKRNTRKRKTRKRKRKTRKRN
jgi:hypothetical protein